MARSPKQLGDSRRSAFTSYLDWKMDPPTKTPWQFSLKAVLCALPVCGVGAIALSRPTPWIVQILFGGTVLAYLLGFTIACVGRLNLKPFAFGIAPFGMSYIATVGLVGGFEARGKISTPLLTTRLLQSLYGPIARPNSTTSAGGFVSNDPPEYLFLWAGHTVLSWIIAALGGMAASILQNWQLTNDSSNQATEQTNENEPE